MVPSSFGVSPQTLRVLGRCARRARSERHQRRATHRVLSSTVYILQGSGPQPFSIFEFAPNLRQHLRDFAIEQFSAYKWFFRFIRGFYNWSKKECVWSGAGFLEAACWLRGARDARGRASMHHGGSVVPLLIQGGVRVGATGLLCCYPSF